MKKMILIFFSGIFITILLLLLLYIGYFYFVYSTNRDVVFSGQFVTEDGEAVRNATFPMMLSKDELFDTLVDIEYEITTDNEGKFRDTIKNINTIYVFENNKYNVTENSKGYLSFDVSKERTENLKITVYYSGSFN